MNSALIERFRVPAQYANIELNGVLRPAHGFFEFGPGVVCYGQAANHQLPAGIREKLPDALQCTRTGISALQLPFNLTQIVDNLRLERYCSNGICGKNALEDNMTRSIYYFLRPLLGIPIRKHLQRARLKGWNRIPFPRWPVDFTVEDILDGVMALLIKMQPAKRIPFIWYWPDGARSALMMTHDVEAVAGLNFCDQLMTLDESAGIRSAFQIVPEVRYEIQNEIIDRFRLRGHEVNVHDLNHDGSLFQQKEEFIRRASEINFHAKRFGTRGFRAGGMYRNQDWFEMLDLSYDMSVPNVAHLEPQRGGCCTVFPYFVGELLELPLTTTQDYSLLHILGDYSIELWTKQIDLIRERHGLISFITHPDYLIESRAGQVYRNLLDYIAKLKESSQVWAALPGEIDRWWRDRSQMCLVPDGESWRIEGTRCERARLAYASLSNGRVVYSLAS